MRTNCHLFVCFHTHSGFECNLFLFCARPPRLFSSPSTMGPPLHRIICRAFSASVRAFVNLLRATVGGCPVPRRSLPSQAKPEPRGVVNRNLAQFPAGRKLFYKMGSPFPAGRKSWVTGCRFSPHGSHPPPGRRRVKMYKLQGAKRLECGSLLPHAKAPAAQAT